MRKIKIRGQKRIGRSIEHWVNQELQVRIDYLQKYKKWYTKIRVSPYCNISIANSIIPEPKGENRKKILSGLITIFNSWQAQLENLNEPYYLKIWIYEPRFSLSQVVCAIGDKINYYENLFTETNCPTSQLAKVYTEFEWKTFIDEDVYSEIDLSSPAHEYATIEDYNYDVKLLNNLRKRNIRRVEVDNDILHFVPKGTIWIGNKPK